MPNGIRLFSPPHHALLAGGYSAAAEVRNPQKLVYTAGQTSIDETGAVVGVGDCAAQAAQVYANLEKVLADANMTLANVVKTTSYLVSRDDIPAFGAARAAAFGGLEAMPASTLLIVASLAHPDFLLEIEAVAVEGA